jgi:hypothetical protein
MEGWHPDGCPGSLAYSPELWEWMFDQCLSPTSSRSPTGRRAHFTVA